MKEMQDIIIAIVYDCTNCNDNNSNKLQRHYNIARRKQQSTNKNTISFEKEIFCTKFCSLIVIKSAYSIVGVIKQWCIVIFDFILL